jgi:histidyl-tRNA synthetase
VSSSRQFKALKGMQDILPPDIYIWQKVEESAKAVFSSFGFKEIRLPIVEATEVFTRSIGEDTDIVEKEMYTFNDKGNRSITLRPEGTASVVRCYVENHLHNLPSPQKYFYSGPMFRYERPQAGRFRQFYQIGVEVFGASFPAMDAEVISMLNQLLGRIHFTDIEFQVNSIGCDQCRPEYRTSLLGFFSDRLNDLCPDCRRRYNTNPLRILDCKVDRCIEIRKGAPNISDYLCSGCRTHFEKLQSILLLLEIPYIVNRDMVRGLDYYSRTIFEVTSRKLGAQNAVVAGGRYDKLVSEFGGPETPAVGFALGMERIIELRKESEELELPVPHVFIATIGDEAERESVRLADMLRKSGIWVELGDSDNSLKSQMRRADRLSARYVFIIGDDEVRAQKLKWKKLSDSTQGETSLSEATNFIIHKVNTD